MYLGKIANSNLRLSLARITIISLPILILICYTTLPIYAQNSAEEYYDSGVEKADSGDYQGAIKDYNKAIEINPNYSEAYFNRGIVKYRLGDYQGEIEDYNKAIEINPDYSKAYYNRGITKLQLGQKDIGCLDLYKARDLGDTSANDTIKKYCKQNR